MNFNSAVVYDASVLYPAPLRDLLLELAGVAQDLGWFRSKWTDQIHDEWIRNLLINRPDLNRQQLNRTRDLMNRHIDDCLVTGYESRITGANVAVIRSALHHKDVKTTLTVYARANRQAELAARQLAHRTMIELGKSQSIVPMKRKSTSTEF